MAKTLLNGVNEVLKRVGMLDTDAGELSTLTDSARQHYIDVAVQSWNEGIDELYSVAREPKPSQLASSTVTFVAATRAYSLASDVVVLRPEFPLFDSTNNHEIAMLGRDGYTQLVNTDREEDDTGLPSVCAVRPTDGKLYFDRSPTASEAGRVYTYRYDKELELTLATDTVPFGNSVFRAMVPAVAELWRSDIHNEFREKRYNKEMGRAARLLSMVPARGQWTPVRVGTVNVGGTDPLEAG